MIFRLGCTKSIGIRRSDPAVQVEDKTAPFLLCGSPFSLGHRWNHTIFPVSELVGGLVAIFYFPRNIGNVIIPIDFHIFQRGGEKPPTSGGCSWILSSSLESPTTAGLSQRISANLSAKRRTIWIPVKSFVVDLLGSTSVPVKQVGEPFPWRDWRNSSGVDPQNTLILISDQARGDEEDEDNLYISNPSMAVSWVIGLPLVIIYWHDGISHELYTIQRA